MRVGEEDDRRDPGSPAGSSGAGQGEALRREDPSQLEGHPARSGHPADPAVPLHRRQERHRLGADHRRDGPAAWRPGRRFLPGVLGQRLHPPGHAHPRIRAVGVRLRRAQDAQALRRRLRPLHLHRNPAFADRRQCPARGGKAAAAAAGRRRGCHLARRRLVERRWRSVFRGFRWRWNRGEIS